MPEIFDIREAREKILSLEAELRAAKGDAERYRWLTEDHADRYVREQCRAILGRMGAMSYSATSAVIDVALAAAPQSAQTRAGRKSRRV